MAKAKRNSRFSRTGAPTRRIAYYLQIGGHQEQICGTAFYSLVDAGLITVRKREQKVVVGLIASLKSHYHTGTVAGEQPFLRALMLDPILGWKAAQDLASRLGMLIKMYGVDG